MLTKETRIWTQKVHLHSVSRMTKTNRFRLDKKKIKKERRSSILWSNNFFGGRHLKIWGEEMVKHG